MLLKKKMCFLQVKGHGSFIYSVGENLFNPVRRKILCLSSICHFVVKSD